MDITWLIEPFGVWNALTILKWYVGAMAAVIAIYLLHGLMGVEFSTSEKMEKVPGGILLLFVGFAAPIFEELIFRDIPAILNAPISFWIVMTVVWILLHGKRCLVIAPLGVLFLKLWLGGFWVEAIVIHVLHNTFLVATFLFKKDVGHIEEYEGVLEDNKPTSTVNRIKGKHARIEIHTE